MHILPRFILRIGWPVASFSHTLLLIWQLSLQSLERIPLSVPQHRLCHRRLPAFPYPPHQIVVQILSGDIRFRFLSRPLLVPLSTLRCLPRELPLATDAGNVVAICRKIGKAGSATVTLISHQHLELSTTAVCVPSMTTSTL